MKLKDIMTTQVEVLPPTATLKECAEKMRSLDVGAIPVCADDRLKGMVTDRDLVIQAIAEGRDPQTTQIKDVMSSPIVYCFEDDDVESAVRVMEVKQIRRLVVLNRDKRLVGVVSIGDVAAKTLNEGLSGEVLEKVSQPVRGRVA
jgi:CBS domain-containing protein